VSKGTAYANLGYHAVKTAARHLFGQRRGLEAFLESYRDDRLPPLTAAERAMLGSFDGCLACGLCDALGRPVDRDDPGGLPGPSALPVSVSRHPPDYDALGRYLERLDTEDLARMEATCPARIPLRRLVEMIRDVAERAAHASVPSP
jgi:hypothetical protein